MNHASLYLAVLAALSSASASAGVISPTTWDVPYCTTSQLNRHAVVRTQQAGIDVRDPDGDYIGWNEADGFLYRNWEPISNYKQTVCGTVDRYEFYVIDDIVGETFVGAEEDYNTIVEPNPAMQWSIDNPVSWGITTLDDLHTCDRSPGHYCLEAEINPSAHYGGNPWFTQTDGSRNSLLVGKSMCSYGPWIADHGHGGRPEIHPSEALWWISYFGPDGTWPDGVVWEKRVVLMEDESGRYNDRSDFDPDLPTSIKPWSGKPRTAYVRVAFTVPESTTAAPQYLHVYESPRVRHVTTSTNSRLWPDDGGGLLDFGITQFYYNDNAKLVVIEHQPDTDLGVVFDETPGSAGLYDLCRTGDGNLQGYVTLRTQYAIPAVSHQECGYAPSNSSPYWTYQCHTVQDDDGEGYQELVIHRTSTASDPASASAAKSIDEPRQASVRGEYDWESIHLETDGERSRLVGSLVLELEPGQTLKSARDAEGRSLSLFAESEKRGGEHDAQDVRVDGVDMTAEGPIALELGSGETVKRPGIGLALTADLDARPNLNRGKSDPAALDSAWRSLLRQLDAHDTRRPASFAHTPLWAVHATPGFASIKDGEPSHEEENELVERLNAAAEKGEPSPLTIQQAVKDLRWSVAPEAKLVGETPAQWERSIAFSRPAEVQQGTVELVLEDIFGQRVTRRQKAWSHVLQASPDALAAELPELVAAVAGVERGLLDAKGSEKRVHDEAAKLSPQASQAELVAHMVRRSSRDGVVTPDELRVLMNLAKELASIPGTDLMNDPIPISDSASDE